MDVLSARFSVYDFFNPLIAGMVFLVSQGIAFCPLYKTEMVNWEYVKEFQGAIIIVGLICAYVIGAVLYAPTHWVIKDVMKYEREMIRGCLNSSELFGSTSRRERFTDKARKYLGVSSLCPEDKENVYEGQCSAFFAHCVYYLQLKKIDGKCERLRETQALSELLSGVFAAASAVDIAITIWLTCDTAIGTMCGVCAVIWAIMCSGFYSRYKMAVKNRIRIVISLYDASIDMEEAACATGEQKITQQNGKAITAVKSFLGINS